MENEVQALRLQLQGSPQANSANSANSAPAPDRDQEQDDPPQNELKETEAVTQEGFDDQQRHVYVTVERVVQDRVIIPFGADQGAKTSMPLQVYLEDEFLTEATLERADPYSSIARLHSRADSVKIGQVLTLIFD